MADFIVQEEDGTSLITLEEGGGSLLLEAAPPPPPAPYATWRAGTVTTPGSTGSLAVTGLGSQPCAVFLFGTNFSTEDTPFSTGGSTGVFRGMSAAQWDDAGVLQNSSAFVSPAGDQSRITGGIVNSLTTAGTASAVDVAASVTSLDADGFTLNFTTVTGAGRKFAWVALMTVDHCGSHFGSTATLGLGWKVGASLMHGAWNGPDYTADGEAGEWYGGAAYPGSVGGGTWFQAGLAAQGYPAHLNQWNIGIFSGNDPAAKVTEGNHFIGPFVVADNITAVPSGGSLTDYAINTGSTNGGQFVFWDDEDSQTGSLTPAQNTGDTVTVSGLPFAPGLVIGYSISDEPQGQSSGSPVRGAIQLSLATDSYQYACIVDANTRGSYQSFQRGFADACNSTSVHAGTIELTSDGFILTTEEDDVTAQGWVWHAFGHPDRIVKWIPHIYRRVQG